MNDLLYISLFVYLTYVLMYAVLHKDIVLRNIKHLLGASREELGEFVVENEKHLVSEAIKEDVLHPSKQTDSKVKEAFERLKRIEKDDGFLDKLIDEYTKDFKIISVTRRVKKFFWFLIRDLYTLIPILVLLFTFNLQLSILVSGVMMLLFSLFEEYMIRLVLDEIYDRDTSNIIMSSISAKANIVLTAILRQSHFYVTLLILLYK